MCAILALLLAGGYEKQTETRNSCAELCKNHEDCWCGIWNTTINKTEESYYFGNGTELLYLCGNMTHPYLCGMINDFRIWNSTENLTREEIMFIMGRDTFGDIANKVRK